MTLEETKKKFREWYKKSEKAYDNWYKSDCSGQPPSVSFPRECLGVTCGAKTRAGTPCKRKDIYRSTRCRYHAGLSTGPRTVEGKKKSAANWEKRWRKMQTP